jgi:hypothetical protein
MAAPSPSNIEELSLLANAIGLEYPPNPLQVNTAVLVLAYLMSRGMGGVKNILRDSTSSNFYLDEFAREIYTIYFRKSGMLYIDSKSIDPETGDPEFSLGNEEDAKLGLIEYKVRRELLTLMRENPTKIDELEQLYDAQDKPTPFGWVRQIKVGYFNVLLGGKDREKSSIGVRVLDRLNKSVSKLNALPAETGKDSISKG